MREQTLGSLGETAVGQFVRRHSCPSGTRGAGLIVRPLSHLVTLEFVLSSEQTLSRTKYYSSSFYSTELVSWRLAKGEEVMVKHTVDMEESVMRQLTPLFSVLFCRV